MTIKQVGSGYSSATRFQGLVQVRLVVTRPDADPNAHWFTRDWPPRISPVRMHSIKPGASNKHHQLDDLRSTFLQWSVENDKDVWSFFYQFVPADDNEISFTLLAPLPWNQSFSNVGKRMYLEVYEHPINNNTPLDSQSNTSINGVVVPSNAFSQRDIYGEYYTALQAQNSTLVASTQLDLSPQMAQPQTIYMAANGGNVSSYQGTWQVLPLKNQVDGGNNFFPNEEFELAVQRWVPPTSVSSIGWQSSAAPLRDDFGALWYGQKYPSNNYNACVVDKTVFRDNRVYDLLFKLMPLDPDGKTNTPYYGQISLKDNVGTKVLYTTYTALGTTPWRGAFVKVPFTGGVGKLRALTGSMGRMALLVTTDSIDKSANPCSITTNPQSGDSSPFGYYFDSNGSICYYPKPNLSFPFTIKPNTLEIVSITNLTANKPVSFSTTPPDATNVFAAPFTTTVAGSNMNIQIDGGAWEFGTENYAAKKIQLLPNIHIPAPATFPTNWISAHTSSVNTFTKSLVPSPANPYSNATPIVFQEAGFLRLTPYLENDQYLGAGNMRQATPYYVGRFVPAYYTVTQDTTVTPTLKTAGCAASGSTAFSYVGQPIPWSVKPQFTITPYNLLNTAMKNVTTGQGSSGIYVNHPHNINAFTADSFQQVFTVARRNVGTNVLTADVDPQYAGTETTYQNDSQGRIIATVDFKSAGSKFGDKGLVLTRPVKTKYADNSYRGPTNTISPENEETVGTNSLTNTTATAPYVVIPGDVGSKLSTGQANRGDFDAVVGLVITGNMRTTPLYTPTQLQYILNPGSFGSNPPTLPVNPSTYPGLTANTASFPNNNLARLRALGDRDGIALAATSSQFVISKPTLLNGVSQGLPFDKSPRMRFGRLLMPETVGAVQGKPVFIPITAQFFDDKSRSWRTNVDESCLAVNITNFDCTNTTTSPYGAQRAIVSWTATPAAGALSRVFNRGRLGVYLIPPVGANSSTIAINQALRVRLLLGAGALPGQTSTYCQRGSDNQAAQLLEVPWLNNLMPPQASITLEPQNTQLNAFRNAQTDAGSKSDFSPSTLVTFGSKGTRN